MFQCAFCEDWFHDRCLPNVSSGAPSRLPALSADALGVTWNRFAPQMPPATDWAVLVCANCTRSHPVLARHRGQPDILSNARGTLHRARLGPLGAAWGLLTFTGTAHTEDVARAGEGEEPPTRRPRLEDPCIVRDGRRLFLPSVATAQHCLDVS